MSTAGDSSSRSEIEGRLRAIGDEKASLPWILALFVWLVPSLVGFALVLVSWWLDAELRGAFPDPPRPGWMRMLLASVLAAPWVVAGVLLLRRVAGRRGTPWLSFGIGVALPWLFLLAVFSGPSLSEYLGRRDFDARTWQAGAGARHGARQTEERLRMVDDLIDSRVLDGRSQAEVRELLGPDDGEAGTGDAAGYFTDWDQVYWLGSERGWFGIDSEWLVIRFDSRGRVAEYRIVTD